MVRVINKALTNCLFIGFCISVLITSAFAQIRTYSLEECFKLVRENYPLIKKNDLINKSLHYNLSNASKLYLPKLNITGQASYQSETFSFPDALSGALGMTPQLDKDQYKIQADLSQNIYDGGISRNQKDLAKANFETLEKQLEVELYTLKDRVSQVFFSIHLMDGQLRQNELRKVDLQNAVDRMTSALKNGVAFRSNVDELKAEMTSVESLSIELEANKQAYLEMMSEFTGVTFTSPSQLSIPGEIIVDTEIRRPELTLFDTRKTTLSLREKQLKVEYLPKLNAFLQGAYGRPTLNIIENKFDFWYIGGLRLNWSLGSLYTLKNDKRLIDIDKKILDTEKETFLFNTQMLLSQQNVQINKFKALIAEDEKAIILRESVKKSSKAQLENGVITVRDYIAQLNAENLARQSQILHKIQLLQTQYNLKITSGK